MKRLWRYLRGLDIVAETQIFSMPIRISEGDWMTWPDGTFRERRGGRWEIVNSELVTHPIECGAIIYEKRKGGSGHWVPTRCACGTCPFPDTSLDAGAR